MRIILHLHAQIADVHHHRAVGDIIIRLVPHRFVDDLDGIDALRVLHQQPQDLVFGLGQVHLPLIHPHPVAVQRKPHAVRFQRGVARLLRCLLLAQIDTVPAQQCLDPGTELRKGEGFCQIVVAARRQAQQLIGFLRFCGEEQDGHR